ncbi:hypothetical protein UFOVP84_118 [uncultured Caudovirales phage]|uniref:Uncharacterized protein n=1 Tax=uncultured Caudovirales phage TaxID=2100421 RepID=A0A6J5L425_9CAUD|nr:hypothetical protein UFOVP84_118 [uncultured Caudovirales phage]
MNQENLIKNSINLSTEEGRLERASMGGKAHKGKKVMHYPGNPKWKRIHPNVFDEYSSNGWLFGPGPKTN